MKSVRETSDFICQKLISKCHISDGMRLLEPSCGNGKILLYLFENYKFKGLKVTGVELNKERLQIAEQTLHHSNKNCWGSDFFFEQADFLKWIDKQHVYLNTPKYDAIIACPPFKANIDLEHIKKMYDEHLKVKGMMATLTSPYWITNNETHQIEFRRWLEGKEYQLEILPDNSFIEKEKSVPTAILTIYKRK